MPNKNQIKTSVQFPEQTTFLKEQSENPLFDILREDVKIITLIVRIKKNNCRPNCQNKQAYVLNLQKGHNAHLFSFNGMDK